MGWRSRIDRLLRLRRWWLDVLLAAVLWLGILVISSGFTSGGFSDEHVRVLAVAVTLQVLPLAIRRKWPTVMLLLVAAGSMIQLASIPEFLPSQIAVPIAIYSAAAHGSRAVSWLGLGLGFLGAILATITYVPVDRFDLVSSALVFCALFAIVGLSWLVGEMTRHRRDMVMTLNARAERLERENQTERALAAADERNRVAREMHDIVAHSLSVMIAQADGGRYAIDSHPDLAKDSLATIAATGRGALAEMRTLLGILRQDDDAALRPAPTLADIPDLLRNAEQSGVDVSFREERLGRAEASSSLTGNLPGGAQLTLYRAAQEGLTNVIKHAGPAVTATVVLRWGVDGARVIVRDNGRGGLSSSKDGLGQGLRGVRERVEHFGGTVFAGPDLAGGFRLEVYVPYSKVTS